MTQYEIDIRARPDLAAIGAAKWDSCACPESADGGPPDDPFTTYRFLHALEQSGSVGTGTGWQPHHLHAQIADQTIAVAPLYLKSHSQGEYIFDHDWAHVYEQAGGRYYPKLQIAVPFTPVTGRRLLTHPDFEQTGRSALIQGALQVAAQGGFSGLHITFCTEVERQAGAAMGLLERTTQQFHWQNNGYENFEDFVETLTSRKRKAIRKERKQAQTFGGAINVYCGADLRPAHWEAFWQFYQDTGRRKWGTPYLTRAFFDLLHAHMSEDVVLVLAEHADGRPIAGALNFIGREALFGRYWGAVEYHPCLHFELCYYQAIEIAIARGLKRVEAGAQGAHKLARGYLPAQTHSLHWMADPGFARAIAHYLEAERAAMNQDIEVLTEYGPFKKLRIEERE